MSGALMPADVDMPGGWGRCDVLLALGFLRHWSSCSRCSGSVAHCPKCLRRRYQAATSRHWAAERTFLAKVSDRDPFLEIHPSLDQAKARPGCRAFSASRCAAALLASRPAWGSWRRPDARQ